MEKIEKIIVKQDATSWQAGYDAGHAGARCVCPVELEGLSFASGYVEGRADRLEGKARARRTQETTQMKR